MPSCKGSFTPYMQPLYAMLPVSEHADKPMLLTNLAARSQQAQGGWGCQMLCVSCFWKLTFVWAADALRLARVEKLLQEGRVLHCLGQKRHHLLLALLCGLQTAHQPLCLLLGVLERDQKSEA